MSELESEPASEEVAEAYKTLEPQSEEEGSKRMSWVETAKVLARHARSLEVKVRELEENAFSDQGEIKARGNIIKAQNEKRMAVENDLEANNISIARRPLDAKRDAVVIWSQMVPLDEIAEILDRAGSDLYAEEIRQLDKRVRAYDAALAAPTETKTKEGGER